MAYRYWKMLLLSVTLGVSTDARAQDYTLMIYEPAQALALRRDGGEAGQRYWADYAAIGADLAKAGVLKGGAALDVTASATAPDKAPVLSGYFIVDVTDRAAAEEWARRIPAARNGRVVVLSHVTMSGKM